MSQTQGETLEAIYEKFNIAHPEDYRGHSLSVSDIVVLHQNGENSAHFVDSFGFTGLPDFMQTLEGVKEQEAEIDTSGQDVQKSESEKQEPETSDNTLEDGDEIIDLGDEKEQVLADMKKSLEIGKETELAFQIADRYISIQEVDGGTDRHHTPFKNSVNISQLASTNWNYEKLTANRELTLGECIFMFEKCNAPHHSTTELYISIGTLATILKHSLTNACCSCEGATHPHCVRNDSNKKSCYQWAQFTQVITTDL